MWFFVVVGCMVVCVGWYVGVGFVLVGVRIYKLVCYWFVIFLFMEECFLNKIFVLFLCCLFNEWFDGVCDMILMMIGVVLFGVIFGMFVGGGLFVVWYGVLMLFVVFVGFV